MKGFVLMTRHARLSFLVAFSLWTTAAAQQTHMHGAAAACAGTELSCANVATPAFGPDGSLWLAWAAGGKVMVARSGDLGRSFAAAVAINPVPAKLDTGPDARPKIVIDGRG